MPETNALVRLADQVQSERTHLVIPSLPHWIGPTVDFLLQKATHSGACHANRSGKLMIALHEAISNAMLHGNLELSSELKEQGDAAFAEAMALRAADPDYNERVVDIVVDTNQECCRWIITDLGRGFDVERVLSRCLSDDPEILLSSGRGILMMRTFLDEVLYELGGRQVVLVLHRQSGQERRAVPRVPLQTGFEVVPVRPDGAVDWSSAQEVVSRNFSENGVSLLQEQLSSSTRVVIGIPQGPKVVYVSAEVRHCRPLEQGGFELGCQFATSFAEAKADAGVTCPLPSPSPEVLQAIERLLESHRAALQHDGERREHRRVVFNERFEIRVAGRSEPIIGYSRDLSKGGIAFITQTDLPSEITIVFTMRGERVPLKVRSRVVRSVRIMDGFFDVGACFMHLDSSSHPPH